MYGSVRLKAERKDYRTGILKRLRGFLRRFLLAAEIQRIRQLVKKLPRLRQGQLIPLDSSVGNEKLTNNIRLVETCHQSHGGRITCRFGPHSTEYCPAEILREIKAQADHFGVGIFTHLSQTEEETFQTNLRNGCRPTSFPNRLSSRRNTGRPDYHRPFLSASESNLRRADPESDSESGILRTRS